MILRGVWERYSRLFVHSLFWRRQTPVEQRRSIGFCLLFLVGYPFVELFHAGCLLLDWIVLVWFWEPPLKEPVFLIGNPRSGTTIAHRVLARDEERFFFFKTWEIAFPSLLQKYVLTALGRIDGWIGRPWEHIVLWQEKRSLEEYQRLHQIGLFLPEEDDKLLVHLLAAIDLSPFFPYGEFQKWARLDLEASPAEQDAVMSYYRGCVLRQAFLKGRQRMLLSKNPFFSGKVETLLRRFPDGKFVYLVRNPLEVVPSTISMARVMVRLACHTETGPELDRSVYDIVKFNYDYPLRVLDRLPTDRWLIVNYDDLIRDPEATFCGIYRHFGWDISPRFRERLDQEIAAMRSHKSRHQYSLESTIITPEQIVRDLQPVFERFGFDTRGKSASTPPDSAVAELGQKSNPQDAGAAAAALRQVPGG